ncbi:glycoside hydrolase domain-containing protein [Burkholderia sp. RS02]|uniref:glycoside hydrolase domain-containing protein n=1 Tax=unclassified Burkholderia TaxID=2613784 RepID=UPI0032187C39
MAGSSGCDDRRCPRFRWYHGSCGWPVSTRERSCRTGSPIPGSDDCGQLSAWYVLPVPGICSLNPVGGVFCLGTPLFKEVTMDIPVASSRL